MVKARKRGKKEKDIIGPMLDNIGFRRLTQDEAAEQDDLIKQLTGRILQRALEAEMTECLGYEKNSSEGNNGGNRLNGYAEKTRCQRTKVPLLRFRETGTGGLRYHRCDSGKVYQDKPGADRPLPQKKQSNTEAERKKPR
jgi:hypothetical protein